MISAASAQAMPQTTEGYEAAFDRLMAEAASINERMQYDRTGIERVERETKTIIEDIVKLKTETRTILASMGAKL